MAANSTYGAGGDFRPQPEGPPSRLTGLLDALDAAPPGLWWSRHAEVTRPRGVVRSLPGEDWLSVPLRRDGPAATTGSFARAAAVGLVIQEDGPLWESYVVQSFVPPPGPLRVLEVRSPEDWRALVARWPRPASATTAGILGNHTGLSGRWLVPDWPTVAGHWDAVHLSVAAWVRTCGVVSSVDDGGPGPAWTMCAGWDPDVTFWLTVQPRVVEERVLSSLTPAEALSGSA